MLALGARCCGEGQKLVDGYCSGVPEDCGPGMRRLESQIPGCVVQPGRVELRGGVLALGPDDWESAGRVQSRRIQVPAFALDRTEVTLDRWLGCVRVGRCRALRALKEPGAPVTRVTPAEAERFCRSAGGRLPTAQHWLFAAVGSGRRYPWGSTGLVCRRAVFGLVHGPCAEGGLRPELAGSRPDGASPDQLLDLVGNVAEWTREADGGYAARGGSFRSRVAASLKGWSVERRFEPADHIGFRCAYPPADARARGGR